MLNTKQCATLCEIFKLPTTSNLTLTSVLTLLNTLGAKVQPTKSGVYANINGVIWGTHRPHPRPYLDKAAVVGLRKALTAAKLTPKALGCVC
jgi:hypothetical protein